MRHSLFMKTTKRNADTIRPTYCFWDTVCVKTFDTTSRHFIISLRRIWLLPVLNFVVDSRGFFFRACTFQSRSYLFYYLYYLFTSPTNNSFEVPVVRSKEPMILSGKNHKNMLNKALVSFASAEWLNACCIECLYADCRWLGEKLHFLNSSTVLRCSPFIQGNCSFK